MDVNLAKKLLPLFTDEKLIIAAAKDSGDTQAAIPFLKLEGKTEKQILSLIKITDFQEDFCREAVPLLKLAGKTKGQIMEIVRTSNYQPVICSAAFPFLDEERILKIVEKAPHNKPEIGNTALPFVKLTEKDPEEIITITQKVNYHADFCLVALQSAKESLAEADIFTIIDHNRDHKEICSLAISLLDFSKKNEEEMLAAIEKAGSSKELCLVALPFFQTERNILSILEMAAFSPEACQVAIVGLKLAEKTEEEIMEEIIYATGYDPEFCLATTPFIKKEKNILIILGETLFEPDLCQAFMPILAQGDLLKLMKKNEYDSDFCHAALPFLKFEEMEEKKILKLLRESAFQEEMVLAALPFLKSVDRITETLDNFSYDDAICQKAISALHLEEKSEKQLFSLVQEVQFTDFYDAIGAVVCEVLEKRKIEITE